MLQKFRDQKPKCLIRMATTVPGWIGAFDQQRLTFGTSNIFHGTERPRRARMWQHLDPGRPGCESQSSRQGADLGTPPLQSRRNFRCIAWQELSEWWHRKVLKAETWCPGRFLLPALAAKRPNILGCFVRIDFPPFNVEGSSVAKQRTPHVVGYVHLDVKTSIAVFVPLAHLRNSGKERREPKVNPTLVEALFTGPEAKPASLIDG